MAAAAPPGKAADSGAEVSSSQAKVLDEQQLHGSEESTDLQQVRPAEASTGASRGREDSRNCSGAAPEQREAGMVQQESNSGEPAAAGEGVAGSQEGGPSILTGDSRAVEGQPGPAVQAHRAKVEVPTSAFGAAEQGSSPAATPEGSAHGGKAAGKRLEVWLDGGKGGSGRQSSRRLSRLRSAYSSIGGRLRGDLSRCPLKL
jgi:hypothetical protein